MKDLFLPKKGLAKNVAFLAILSAVLSALSLVLSFFPFASFFVTVFIPGVASLAPVLAEKKYLPAYLVAASLLTVAFGFNDIGNALFYLLPALLSGTLIGFFVAYRWPFGLAIFLSALLSMGLAYLSLPVTKALTDIDFVQFSLDLLGLSGVEGIYDIVPAFFFAYGVAGTSLASFFVVYLARRIGITEREKGGFLPFVVPSLGLLLEIVALIVNVHSPLVSFLLTAMALLLTLEGLVPAIGKNPAWLYVLLVLLEIGTVFLFAYLASLAEGKNGLVFLGVYFLPLALFSLVSSALPHLRHTPKMGPKA